MMGLKNLIKKFYYLKIRKLSMSDVRIIHLRKIGAKVGEHCFIFSDEIETTEPYLLSIGDGVTIAAGVRFATHDDSSEYSLGRGNLLVGRVTIGNDVFIGMGSIVLPGVSIADHCIVGAGSVVTKSVMEAGTVVAGNPARPIGTVDSIREKNIKKAIFVGNLPFQEKKNLLLKNQDHFIIR